MIYRYISITRQQGFSLVEIMIAMVLGIVILLVVSEVFINNSFTRNEVEKSGRQIENGTYALRLLEDELTNAGYWGEAGAQSVASLPPLCPTAAADISAAMGYPVQGEAASGSNCADSKDGSAFLAIRRASTCAIGSAGCAAANSNFHLQVSACQSESPGTVRLSTNIDGDLVLKKRDCETPAPVYRFFSRVFYVNDDDILMRAELADGSYNTVTSLVDDIEVMRFEYGLDTDKDAQVDQYTSTPSGVEWADVIAVKVSLIARNPQATPGYTDKRTYTVAGTEYEVPDEYRAFKRQFYSTTVYLPNVAGRRESSK